MKCRECTVNWDAPRRLHSRWVSACTCSSHRLGTCPTRSSLNDMRPHGMEKVGAEPRLVAEVAVAAANAREKRCAVCMMKLRNVWTGCTSLTRLYLLRPHLFPSLSSTRELPAFWLQNLSVNYYKIITLYAWVLPWKICESYQNSNKFRSCLWKVMQHYNIDI